MSFTTQWALPYSVNTDQITDGHLTVCRLDTNVWLEDPLQAINAGVTVTRPSPTLIAVTAPFDLTTVPVLIGIIYHTFYQWTTIYFRNQKGGIDQRGRLRLGYMNISYEPTTDFTITVIPQGRDPYTYVFHDPTAQTSQGPADLEYKPFRVPLQCRNEDSVVQLTNDTPGGTRIVAYDWEGTLTYRSRAQ